MLSSSIEDWERGDEQKICPGLGKYQRRIAKRGIRNKRNIPSSDEVETIDPKAL